VQQKELHHQTSFEQLSGHASITHQVLLILISSITTHAPLPFLNSATHMATTNPAKLQADQNQTNEENTTYTSHQNTQGGRTRPDSTDCVFRHFSLFSFFFLPQKTKNKTLHESLRTMI
jgi:hypothetical protein